MRRSREDAAETRTMLAHGRVDDPAGGWGLSLRFAVETAWSQPNRAFLTG